MSEQEFQRIAKRAEKANRFVAERDKTWKRPGETSYVLTSTSADKKSFGILQVALFKDHELVFLADQVHDKTGSATLSRAEATDILADYRRYMCWRFGAVSERSSLGADTRNAILGPAQIYEQAAAGDGRVSMDAFVVEVIKGKLDDVQLIVGTRMAEYGEK